MNELSTLTNDDYISLVSTVEAAFNGQFNCSLCLKKFPLLPDRLVEHRTRLGCDGKVNPNFVYLPAHDMANSPKIIYNRCIGNFYSNNSMELIRYLSKFKKDIFPYPGSYYEQPNKFVESLELINNLIEQKQKERETQLNKSRRR